MVFWWFFCNVLAALWQDFGDILTHFWPIFDPFFDPFFEPSFDTWVICQVFRGRVYSMGYRGSLSKVRMTWYKGLFWSRNVPKCPEKHGFWPIFGRFWPIFGRKWPIFGRFLADFWPKMTDFWPIFWQYFLLCNDFLTFYGPFCWFLTLFFNIRRFFLFFGSFLTNFSNFHHFLTLIWDIWHNLPLSIEFWRFLVQFYWFLMTF